ncbi:hypothetical protein [Paenibacillus sonchi]|uniref:hypothetical protein n=1 Tax=Paenibacillus sonchi TaxID=373687 RepID=UPI001E3A4E62|nr:hypothetical protein [Paenibacillus sonchi]MCE3203413.1 hypothetical protein [Paenibacillus sonchi]
MKGTKDMLINDVKTTNFPYEVIDGEEHYPLHSTTVVESITEKIPDELKAVMTIDYSQIPESYFQKVKAELGVQEANPVQAAKNESLLLDVLERDGAFHRLS